MNHRNTYRGDRSGVIGRQTDRCDAALTKQEAPTMPKTRSILALTMLAGLVFAALSPGLAPSVARAQPVVTPVPPPATSGSTTTEDLTNRLRGAPTSRSGAATRGLGGSQESRPPANANTQPPAPPPASTTGG
jgi:hypothetical protein